MSKICKKSPMKPDIVGPLNFSLDNSDVSIPEMLFPKAREISCLLCDLIFKLNTEKHSFLEHLFTKHRFIIGDEDQIELFHEYVMHWRGIFEGDDSKITEFCTIIIMDQLPDGSVEKNVPYYMLSDVSTTDYEIRQKLRSKQIDLVLAMHKFERSDETFEKSCLFCRDIIKSTRHFYIRHLYNKHFLQLGKPENLVFIDMLIDVLQLKLVDMICIFCEKKFKDRSTLKEHMRKKGHKRINPDNKTYDKFFLINYQFRQETKQKRTNRKKNESLKKIDDFVDCDSNWSDWEGDIQEMICLFCPQKNNDFIEIKKHINDTHKVNFDLETSDKTFYEKVKIVNFVRRQMFLMQCITCNQRFSQMSELYSHLSENDHFALGNRDDWDLPQYFFPTYEDDFFLCCLENFNSDEMDDVHDSIITEESNSLHFNEAIAELSKEHWDK